MFYNETAWLFHEKYWYWYKYISLMINYFLFVCMHLYCKIMFIRWIVTVINESDVFCLCRIWTRLGVQMSRYLPHLRQKLDRSRPPGHPLRFPRQQNIQSQHMCPIKAKKTKRAKVVIVLSILNKVYSMWIDCLIVSMNFGSSKSK